MHRMQRLNDIVRPTRSSLLRPCLVSSPSHQRRLQSNRRWGGKSEAAAAGVLVLRRAHAFLSSVRPSRCLAVLADKASSGRIEDASVEGREFAVAAARVLNDTKCEDVVVLNVSKQASWCSFMVFGSVFSKPQLLAALAKVEQMALQDFEGRERSNNPGQSPWECLDYGDVLVHVMSQDQRSFYDVESFYTLADVVPLPFDSDGKASELSQTPKWTREIKDGVY